MPGRGLHRSAAGVVETSGPRRALAAFRDATPVTPVGLATLPYQPSRWSNSYSGTGAGAVGS
jgi:hypothetical protein